MHLCLGLTEGIPIPVLVDIAICSDLAWEDLLRLRENISWNNARLLIIIKVAFCHINIYPL